MIKQYEMDVPKPKPKYIRHGCRVRSKPYVLLQKALDPKYLVGTCPRCRGTVAMTLEDYDKEIPNL